MLVRFVEGAPKDRFEIRNEGSCAIGASTLTLDLSLSAGGLIFDVTGRGAGVEVFQPFEVVRGQSALAALPQVTDGQDQLELKITDLPPGGVIAFTIDVDDTLGARAITVSGAEITGATVSHLSAQASDTAVFTAEATAELAQAPC
ncbi:aggregation factor core [Pseudoruegeria sp. SHC-113]|nr:aggregation factor core [Pseudoruegeria sp. SHC-113]